MLTDQYFVENFIDIFFH